MNNIYIRTATFLALMLIGLFALSACQGAKGKVQLEQQIRAESQSELDQCNKDLESIRSNNALLIETNARLTTQVDSAQLDMLASGTDLKSRLSECEFRNRELEDSISEKQTQMGELELDVENYSADLRSAMEDKQEALAQLEAGKAGLEAIQAELDSLADEFAVEFEHEIGEGLVVFEVASGRESILVRNSLLFKPGSANLTKKGKSVLRRVAGAIKSLDVLEKWNFTVAGHTDNIAPGKSMRKKYPTNLEISLARAAAVVHRFVDVEGFPPALVGAMGYGEHRPVSSNETRVGRAENLRIVFSVEPAPQKKTFSDVSEVAQDEADLLDADKEDKEEMNKDETSKN